MLLNLLPRERIRTKLKASDWQEVAQTAGELLLKDNLIKPSYIKAMIKSVEDNGPYIVVAEGIAIFHARPEDGVEEIGMSLVTLGSPINFGHKDHDPVKIAFAFCALDKEKHVDGLSELMTLLMEEGAVDKIYQRDSSLEVYDYIKKVIQ